MAKQSINIGSVPNDGTGSTLRDAGDLINDNFNEIYTAIGDGTTLTAGTFVTTTNTVSLTNKTISGASNTLSNIGNSSLSNSTITIGDDTSTNFTLSLGGSFEIVGGSGINTAIENNRIVLSTDGSIVTETSSDTLTNKTINAPDNTITNISNSNLSGTAGITNANLANSTISISDDSSTSTSISLGGGFSILGGTGLTSSVNGSELTLSVDSTVVTETSTDTLTNKTISGASNTLSNIANASLTNSSITIGSDTLNLGDTTTTITGLSLDGTGTIDLTGSGSKARFNFAGFGSLPTAATYEGMFAYDTTGQRPYVADAGGWVRILDENSNIDAHSDVNKTGVADGYILQWSSAQARFNTVPLPGSTLTVSDDTSTSASLTSLGLIGGTGISTAIDPGNNTVTITNTGPTNGFAIAMSIAL